MLKQLYRIIILIGIFVASIYFFSKDIKEVVFDTDNTTVMEETTLPLVTIKLGEQRINLLHGYSTNLDANSIREAVTPLGQDQSFEIIIDQEEYDIKKVNYELRDFFGNDLIETDSISVFEENGEEKSAKIKFQSVLKRGKEYAVKITLITSESKKMYYYQRVKPYDNAYLDEKLAFVMDFHNAIKDKKAAENIIKYIESKKNADNTSLASVNINSSFELVSWGNLKPEFITEIIPDIIEINSDTATVVLDYIVKVEIAGVPELSVVKEFYRVRYTKDRMYLLNYERSMEALFDTKLASVTKSQLKLGISSELKVPFLASADKTRLSFVRNRELWYYNLEDNEMIRIFSFRQENTDYIRDYYDQHDIRILNMDAEGNIDFLVYGYMNRGQYEGRVAVILYEYIREDNRIEEKVYIPVDEPYQMLKENLSSFTYVNLLEVFYFHLYGNIYSYNLITGQLNILATGIDQDKVVFLQDKGFAAWQGNSDPKQSDAIKIMELETGEITTIDARAGYHILLMDMIDSNLIYGFVRGGDITTMVDGKTIVPVNSIEIATIDRQVLKNYSKPGYFIKDLKVKDNIIELYRVQMINTNGTTVFTSAPQDYIMNQVKKVNSIIEVTLRVTEEAMTELYLTMPAGFTMEEIPKTSVTASTVISTDPTLRLEDMEPEKVLFFPYIAGKITGFYEEAADAIEQANIYGGVVISSNHQLVWERGGKDSKNIISGFDDLIIDETQQTLESCIELLLGHLGNNTNRSTISLNGSSAYEIIGGKMANTPVRLTGITLEEALYYVSKGRPIIAMTDHENAVLIYGYDNFNINVVDPNKGKAMKIGLQDSKEMFEEAGNVFLSYLEK
ncbi:MAG TPA: hypothetical protein VJ888_04765 [Mobilitalea sp.]|nr:hypothetical protein [Mobilitalea sp.]